MMTTRNTNIHFPEVQLSREVLEKMIKLSKRKYKTMGTGSICNNIGKYKTMRAGSICNNIKKYKMFNFGSASFT
jgi:hypothetical protein